MSETPKPPDPPALQPREAPANDREARLAAALRANLRRRKAQPKTDE